MSGIGLVACQGFLVRGACVCALWVELDLFSLECNGVSSSEFLGVYGFGMVLGSLCLVLRTVFLLWWRISMVCLALELVGSWMELGFNVDMEAFVYKCSLESGVL